jgi:hypothetical protein
MRCRHCYHKFTVFWFFTIGKQTLPPQSSAVPACHFNKPSYAARRLAQIEATRSDPRCNQGQSDSDCPDRRPGTDLKEDSKS